MMPETLEAILLSVGELFAKVDAKYTIPIYQRNYSWEAEHIHQLISDVRDAMNEKDENYFLGNLIVTGRVSKGIDYEVIDGQQRLTTLYLLLSYLYDSGQAVPDHYMDRLRYQSRHRSTNALLRISSSRAEDASRGTGEVHQEDQAIHQGFNIIRQFMDQQFQDPDKKVQFAKYLQHNVTVVRAALPKSTDLNRYFEIMNTRGQQLQQVDILKARLMAFISGRAEQACFAWVWEACAEMDSYVQMSLTHGDTEARRKLFGNDWAWLRVESFDEILDVHRTYFNRRDDSTTFNFGDDPLTLDKALKEYANAGVASEFEEPEKLQFRSIIEFPSFLLHVLKVWQKDDSTDEGGLDDKKLIKHFVIEFDRKSTAQSTMHGKVLEFLVVLLRCRNYFDGYVLKRKFPAANVGEGEWSLERLIKRNGPPGNHTASLRYINTATEDEDDGEVESIPNDLLLIESMLRITYTSPRAMHWITLVLRTVTEKPKNVVASLSNSLRNYAREQVRRQLTNGEPALGFAIGRIVFTYVDYLLVTKANNGNFRFAFRNSIEHFYPQTPDRELQAAYGVLEKSSDLELFGNLALVTVRDNSKFTNSLPSSKANFPDIVAQSPKLGKMAEIALAHPGAWNSTAIKEHHAAMVNLLRSDLGIS